MTNPATIVPTSPALVGAGAAVLTSVLWTFTAVFFTEGGKRLGSTVVNAVRLVFAVALLALTFRFLTSETGAWWPAGTERQIALLALSGLVGLTLGDQALFTALVDVGPRMTTLVMTTAPVFAAFFGWVALGEALEPTAWIGVGLTLAGVAWIVFERPPTAIGLRPPHRTRGLVLAAIGALCQAGGLILSKLGMGHGLEAAPDVERLAPQAATYVRMSFGAAGMLPILLIHHLRRHRTATERRAPRLGSPRVGVLFVLAGAVVGPYLGVWMSLVAVDLTAVGIAQTLMSLGPIFIVPISVWIYRERLTPRALVGAVLAVAGVGVLFLVG